MGRPKMENARRNIIQVRLTDAEYETLKSIAENTGESMSYVIRKTIDDYSYLGKADDIYESWTH